MGANEDGVPRSRILQQALDHWEALRGAAALPRRAALDPLDVPSLLPFSELIEVLDGGEDFRYRLIGSEIDRISEGFYTGRKVSEIPHQRPPSRIFSLYAETVARRSPVCRRLPYVGPLDFIEDVEAITLPLAADGDGAAASVLWGVVAPKERRRGRS